AVGAVEPYGRQLRHRQAEPPSLRHELDPKLEAGIAVDADTLHERARICLEGVGRIVSPDVRDQVQRDTREARDTALHPGAAHLLATAHVSGCTRDDDAAFHQPGELIDLHRVITAIRHGHDHHVGGGLSDTEAKRVRRPATERVEQRPQAWLVLHVALEKRDGRVLGCVVDDQHLSRQCDRLEDAIEKRDDASALVVCGNHDADPWGHTLTPLPRRLVMSTTGFVVRRSAYSRCGAAMISRSDSATTISRGTMSGSPVTYGSVQSTRAALPVRMRFIL